MCFGNQTQKEVTQVSTPDPAVKAAAQGNLNFTQNLRDAGFSPYTGQQVAPFSGQQQSSFDMANTIAGAGVPNVDAAGNLINSYAGAGAGSVSPERIYQNMSPYMNQYVNMALAPQLELQNQQFADQNRNLNRAATSSGAFGDARAGIEAANLTTQQNIARTGLIGNAYNAAFNTAIGAGAQDTATNLQGQTTNAGLREQALGRQLGGAQALEGLGTYQVGTGTQLANLQNTMGQQQTAQSQAGLNAKYNQWLMAQQYPFQTAQLVNQTVGAGSAAMPANKTETTSAPDNSGWAMAGNLIGSAAQFLPMLSDARAKKDIAEVGRLHDDTPVFSFSYRGDPTGRTHVGLIAQDVERRVPAAVVEIGGLKHVDYRRATGLARAIGAMAA